MVGYKRKDASFEKLDKASSYKRTKVEARQAKSRRPRSEIEAEAETDSDPIIESDTPEFSGEDDGVSWPSDDPGDGEDYGHDRDRVKMHDEKEIHGKNERANTQSSENPSGKPKGSEAAGNPTVSKTSLTLTISSLVIEGSPCQTESHGTREKGSQAEC